VVAPPVVLALDVDEVGRRRVEPLREQAREVEGDFRVFAEEAAGIEGRPHRHRGTGPDRGGVGKVEQR